MVEDAKDDSKSMDLQKRFEKKRDKIERKNALKDQFVPKNTPVISIRK